MFGEKFIRDFFEMPPETHPAIAYDRSVMERALKLCDAGNPAMNIVPYLELIKAADALKCDVARRGEG